MKASAALALTGGLLLGCGGTERPDADAGALLACRSFFQVADDYETLTRSELRDRLRGVDNNAKLSEEPGIAVNARQMLVAATNGDDNALIDAVRLMGDACHAID